VEEGVWQLGALRIEARRVSSSVTDNAASWVGEPYSYQAAYTRPVVLGQVMTSADAGWSTFWCYDGASRKQPPSATGCAVGKHVAEDPDTTRAVETLGVVVIESFAGSVDGVTFEVGLGPDTVRGIDNGPPFLYSLSAFTQPPQGAIVTQAAMDGINGGWAYLHGADPLQSNSLALVIDEDQLSDAERSHTTEQVGYLVFETATSLRLQPR